MRVCLQNGTSLDSEVLSPTTNFPESVFENITVSVNGVMVSDNCRGYHFKSYINKNLGISKATKGLSLLSNFWSEDLLESDIKIEEGNLSKGFKERATLIEKSRDIYFIFSPMIDILTTERYLPPRTQLKIELERGPTAMCLLSPNEDLNLKIQISEINMSVRPLTQTLQYQCRMKNDFWEGLDLFYLLLGLQFGTELSML